MVDLAISPPPRTFQRILVVFDAVPDDLLDGWHSAHGELGGNVNDWRARLGNTWDGIPGDGTADRGNVAGGAVGAEEHTQASPTAIELAAVVLGDWEVLG